MTSQNQILNLISSILTIIFITYGSWILIKEIFCCVLPLTLLLTGLFVVLIHVLRIPAPDPSVVETIIGKDLFSEENDGSYLMKTVAHRGAGLDAPENSLAAFKMCNEKGCDVIEFDVSLTKDGIPIIFHDRTVERMAESDLVVNDSTWSQLKDLDISVKHPFKERYPNTNIPTLDEAVKQMLDCGQRMFIDIKDNNMKMVPIIHKLFDTYPELLSRAIVTSFFPNIIYMVRRGNPKIVCTMAWRPNCFANESFKYPEGKGPRRANTWYYHLFLNLCDIIHAWALPRITYYLLGLPIILLHKDVISGKVILNWRKNGVRVMAWTVNSVIEKQHIAKNLKITYLTDTLTGLEKLYNFVPVHFYSKRKGKKLFMKNRKFPKRELKHEPKKVDFTTKMQKAQIEHMSPLKLRVK